MSSSDCEIFIIAVEFGLGDQFDEGQEPARTPWVAGITSFRLTLSASYGKNSSKYPPALSPAKQVLWEFHNSTTLSAS